ncbi:MAG: ABC transporter permease [Gemmatimonadetes bacterium]|nr:ABC transporter permease [Gemmatimonadota bacterium]
MHLFPRDFRRTYGEDLTAAYLDLRDDVTRDRSGLVARWALTIATLRTGWEIARGGFGERWTEARRLRRVPTTQRTESMLTDLWSDLRFALRNHRKHPTVAILAVITLALGVGAGTAIFSVVNGVILKPLPYRDATRLVSLEVNSGIGSTVGFYGLSEPELLDFGNQVSSFSGVAGYTETEVTLGDSLSPKRIEVVQATASLIPLLGVDPLLGRTFSPEEDRPGAPRLAVLSYGTWQAEFGGDPSVLGRSIDLNDQPTTVIGVMPPNFAFPAAGEGVYSQLELDRENPWARNNHYLSALARLAPGATLRSAQNELDVLASRATRAYPDFYPNTGLRVALEGYRDSLVGTVKTPLYVLLAAVGFLLLTVCVNVANLLLARGETRTRELAIRTSLGASRRRVVRQLFNESLVLAVLGGAAGLGLAVLGVKVLLAMAPSFLPRLGEIGIDHRVLLFSLLAVVATGMVFGMMPALHAGRRDVHDALRVGGGERGATRAGQGLRRALVVAQVALAVVLITGSGLMLRTVANLRHVDMGFTTKHVLTLRLNPRPSVYDTGEKRVAFYKELLSRVDDLPGVSAAAAAYSIPMTGGGNTWSILIEGQPAANVGDAPAEPVQRVTPGYLRALGLTLVKGRWINDADDATSIPVVVVSESMARKYWPGEDPLGKRMKVFSEGWPWMQVVGVVNDVRHRGPGAEPRPRWYVPYAQAYVSAYDSQLANTILVRADTDPTPLLSPVEGVVRELDPGVPISRVRTMDQILEATVGSQRFVTRLLTAFGLLALCLAVVGVYGVVSYSVSERTHEIGLRMALGARAGEVLARILREGVLLALVGLSVGLVASALLSRVFASMVFGIDPTDPLTYAGVSLVQLAAVVLASFVPARRASRVSPVQALRE